MPTPITELAISQLNPVGKLDNEREKGTVEFQQTIAHQLKDAEIAYLMLQLS